MKKLLIAIIIVTVFCVIGGFLWTLFDTTSTEPYFVTQEEITVGQSPSFNGNAYQKNAFVDMFSINGKLYYYIQCWPGSFGLRSRFNGNLCSVAGGKIVPLIELSSFYGADETYVYGQSNGYIVAYDVITNETIQLIQCKDNHFYNATQEPDGTFRIVVTGADDEWYFIKAGIIVETTKTPPEPLEYTLNEKQYSIQDCEVYCQDVDISEQFASASFRALIPYQNGLLMLNDGYGNLLYYFQSDGTIQLLFPEFPCMCSTSSVNFYEDYIFVSFSRWESYGETGKGMKAFENDTLVGTYRIDMKDHSIVKISDNTYNGMFIFDDMCIYACNREGDIHQLDFDGNVLQRIVD